MSIRRTKTHTYIVYFRYSSFLFVSAFTIMCLLFNLVFIRLLCRSYEENSHKHFFFLAHSFHCSHLASKYDLRIESHLARIATERERETLHFFLDILFCLFFFIFLLFFCSYSFKVSCYLFHVWNMLCSDSVMHMLLAK